MTSKFFERSPLVPLSTQDFGASTTGTTIITNERFRAFFRGAIDEVEIYYPEAFDSRLGTSLAKLPHLRKLTIFENDPNSPSELDWTTLCAKLRTIKTLEELELGGDLLSDAAIAPLTGHPRLHTVTFSNGRLTSESLKILRSLPALRKLVVFDQLYSEDFWISPSTYGYLTSALPGIEINLGQRFPR
ncbi:MAG: hypothetical protein R3F19_26210, partial [Verrucomicrobiales bacterium]